MQEVSFLMTKKSRPLLNVTVWRGKNRIPNYDLFWCNMQECYGRGFMRWGWCFVPGDCACLVLGGGQLWWQGVRLLVILKPAAQPSTISLFPSATAASTMWCTRNLAKMAFGRLMDVGALRRVIILALSCCVCLFLAQVVGSASMML